MRDSTRSFEQHSALSVNSRKYRGVTIGLVLYATQKDDPIIVYDLAQRAVSLKQTDSPLVGFGLHGTFSAANFGYLRASLDLLKVRFSCYFVVFISIHVAQDNNMNV